MLKSPRENNRETFEQAHQQADYRVEDNENLILNKNSFPRKEFKKVHCGRINSKKYMIAQPVFSVDKNVR